MKKIIFALTFSQICFAQQKEFTNNIGMSFVYIPAGKVTIGKFAPTVNLGHDFFGPNKKVSDSPPDSVLSLAQKMAEADARPGFEVEIKNGFYMGKFEVTQAQYQTVMGYNPAHFKDSPQNPVENVSWKEAQAFVKKLNKLDPEHKYRLPTEFEWEYAARAGKTDDIAWKDIWAQAVTAKLKTAKVGTKKPNDWGLYDTLGNVWEWVSDLYNEKIFADPVPPTQGREHVLKGAPFYGDVKNATYMTHAAGPGSGYDVGFRVLMEEK